MTLDLSTDVRLIKGVGGKKAKRLNRLGIYKVEDLLFFLPRRYIVRKDIKVIAHIKPGEDVVVRGRIIKKFKRHKANLYEAVIEISDGSGVVELIWRNMDFILNRFEIRGEVVAAGRVYPGRRFGSFRMYHPEIASEEELKGIVPVYPQTEGLKSRAVHNLIRRVIDSANIHETLPEYIIKGRNLVSLKKALEYLHFPKSMDEVLQGKKRIIYERFLKFYISLNISASFGRRRAIPLVRKGFLTDKFVENLPFNLTDEQVKAMKEIEEDLSKDQAMHRLLQGDVGTGKTVVMLWASLIAVENGYQAAIMAPTEILAEQVFYVTKSFLKGMDINLVLLTSSLKSSTKRNIRREIHEGRAQIIVGTHALITEKTIFKNLALAIVDEQHRFGVAQRARLLEKAGDYYPHFLVSTATPIPRTLALTVYGDLKVSRIRKRPFKTVVFNRVVKKSRRSALYKWLFQKIRETGRQAYIIAPTIEDSEKVWVESVISLYEDLIAISPPEINIGVIHGKMSLEERSAVMEKFRCGKIHALVSTTVVEVGVDVPNAKFMVVEDANRFGIAQLHQLRGRILRNPEPAYFIMVIPERITYESKMRIRAVESITDGFVLAEEDMKIRGPGEIMGTKQHGEWSLKGINLAEISMDERFLRIVEVAKRDAEHILSKDSYLQDDKNEPLRVSIKNINKNLIVG